MKAIPILALALVGCGPSHHDYDRAGRYQPLAPQAGQAQLILDTSTGCVFFAGEVSNDTIERKRQPRCIGTGEISAASGFKVIGRSPAGTSDHPITITSKDDYAKLPKGTVFIAPGEVKPRVKQ